MTARELTAQDLELAELLMASVVRKSETTRHLFTDSVAVENDLGLARQKQDPSFLQRARERVEAVHATLGRHRPDSGQAGWLSGLSDSEARLHPTRGGLRSGLELGERELCQPLDEHSERRRDGQVFRHLARWMSALEKLFRVTGLPQFLGWAEELAAVAYARFVHQTSAGPQMFSKMSCDLSRPLVPDTDPLDPLDGLATFMRLQMTAGGLEEECSDFAQMVEGRDLSAQDPEPIARLLWDASELRPFVELSSLCDGLVALAAQALAWLARALPLQTERGKRNPSGELTLAWSLDRASHHASTRRLCRPYRQLSSQLIDFWKLDSNRQKNVWLEQQSLNEVLLAGALLNRCKTNNR